MLDERDSVPQRDLVVGRVPARPISGTSDGPLSPWAAHLAPRERAIPPLLKRLRLRLRLA